MKVVYKKKRLALIETNDFHKLKLPATVVDAARDAITAIYAMPDERGLRTQKSLNYKKRHNGKEVKHSIRLNDQYRILFEIDRDIGGAASDIHQD